MVLEPFLLTPEDAVWWSMLALPAVYGALTVFPIASMAKDHFGKGAGVLAAWLIAFMPAHVTHSTWALADHDAFVMLFISIGFMYWLRAVKYSGSARITKTTSAHPLSFVRAFNDVAQHRQAAMANAALSGVAFGIVALGWKGFVVGPSILFLAYALQVALNMFRRRDSTTLSVMFLVMLTTIFLMALPFYAHPQFNLVFDSTGLQPFLFIFGFTLAIAFVTTGFETSLGCLSLGHSPPLLPCSLPSFTFSRRWNSPMHGTCCSPAAVTSPRPRFSARLLKRTHPTELNSLPPLDRSRSCSLSSWAEDFSGEVFATEMAPLGVWCLGLCGDVHGLERCSFHVQRYAHHGHSWSGWNHGVLEVG